MTIAGIIAEYNPFHKGHKYHIQETKELLQTDYIIAVMSGDFVQRGTPALCSKHLRAKMALEGGADLVLELPVFYASASAEFFAQGAVSLLDSLGVVTHLSFGSEAGSTTYFKQVVPLLLEEPDNYQNALQNALKQGLSYPHARMEALLHCHAANPLTEITSDAEFRQFLSSPNNILGIEYYKAIARCQSSIRPFTIERAGAGYHDLSLESGFASASAIRDVLQKNMLPKTQLHSMLPKTSASLLQEQLDTHSLVWPEHFSLLLHYALLGENLESLLQYQDMSEELARRILRCRNEFISFPQFCQRLKTKELTYTRIQRALLHVLLRIPASICLPTPYARILGMRKSAGPLLRQIREVSRIPLLNKPAQQEKELSQKAQEFLMQDVFASNLYEAVRTKQSSSEIFLHEYQKPMVLI